MTIYIYGYKTFEWFEDIEECNDFIKDYKSNIKNILECQEIRTANSIELELEE